MLVQTRLATVFLTMGLLGSGATIAADNGYYLGGSIGQARASFDHTVFAGIAPQFDSSAYAWKAFGGYQFSQYFSAELNYYNLGGYNGILVDPTTTRFGAIDITGWGGSLVGAIPLGKSSFSVLVRGGAAYMRETFSNPNFTPSPGPVTHANIWSPTYGIGLKYDFNPNLSARGEIERFTKIGDSAQGYTVGGHVTQYSAGLAYKF